MKGNKLGLLFVINDFNVGGAEIFVLRLGKALLDEYNIYILDISPEKVNSDFKKTFTDNGFVSLLRYPVLGKIREFVFWKINAIYQLFGKKGQFSILKKQYQVNQLRKIIKNEGIKIVHSHFYSSDCFSRNIITDRNVKKVISMHGGYNENVYLEMPEEQKGIFLDNSRRNIEECDALVNAADVNLKILDELKITITNDQKIDYGFELQVVGEANNGLKEANEFTFCMVARADATKGWKEVLESFIIINKKHPSTRLICVGPLEGILLDLKNKYKDYNSITFTGYAENPVEYVIKADVCLLPTYFPGESLPYSIIEYLSCGKPVIATKTCEIPYMLSHESKLAGVLIDPDKLKLAQYDELISAMEKMMINQDFYNDTASLTKLAFQKFSMDTCKSRYIQLYESLLV